MFDTGGGARGSFGDGSNVLDRFSVDVGAVAYTERFGLDGEVPPEVLEEALVAISSALARLDDRPPPAVLVGMGGAITNMTAVMLELEPYDPDRVQGATLDRAEVDRQIERYRSRDADTSRDRRASTQAVGDPRGRVIVRTVMEKFGMTSLTVSDRGVRHGLLVDRFGA